MILLASIIVASLDLTLIHNQPNLQSEVQYEVEDAFPNLLFDHPIGICSTGDGTNRLLVVGQMGLVYVFNNTREAATSEVFLDIQEQIHQGAFLGLALHPNFENNGLFYIHYLADNPLRTVIAQLSILSDQPNKADTSSQKIILEIPRSYESHAGGQLAFGPDGYLYISLGDGNPKGDATGNAQNRSSLFGKILRIDVELPSQGRNYSIPQDNPFAGNTAGFREEIYAYGFRNPWRFSFDPVGGKLWVGDVGQDRMEEIDVVEKGGNYGWNIMEGTLPYAGGNTTGLAPPVWEYGRDQGNATIGGYVYRGSTLEELVGSYIYGDYVSGRIWALSDGGSGNLANRELLKTDLQITSFGVDEERELYVCSQNGRIYRIRAAPAN